MLERSIRYSIARKKSERELKIYRDRLEDLVKERTEQLETANEKLRVEIAERKRADDALRRSQRRLADIIEFLPDATFVIDNEGIVIAWNRAIEAMTGISKSEMIGKGDFEYSLPFYGIGDHC